MSWPVEHLTRSIVNKLLHAPISRLRDQTDREAGLVRLEEARSLFALDDDESGAYAGDFEGSEVADDGEGLVVEDEQAEGPGESERKEET